MVRHRWALPWGTLLASLFPIGMLVILVLLVWSLYCAPDPGFDAQTDRCGATRPLCEDRPFRWVAPLDRRSALVPWYGWHLAQVRHGNWQQEGPYWDRPSPPRGRHGRTDVVVKFSGGEVKGLDAASSDWVTLSPAAIESRLGERLETEHRGPFHLNPYRSETWVDVARMLSIAQQHLEKGERWALGVMIVPYRGLGTWSAVFVPPPAKAGPILRFEGTTSALGSGPELHVGEEVFHFPDDSWGYYEWGPLADAAQIRRIEAANAVWPEAEEALSAAARGHESITLSIDEQDGPVPWHHVVAILDILLASGVETVSFAPGNFALRIDVAWTPDPLSAWVPPQPLPTLWLLLAALGGLLLALAAGLLRASPSSR